MNAFLFYQGGRLHACRPYDSGGNGDNVHIHQGLVIMVSKIQEGGYHGCTSFYHEGVDTRLLEHRQCASKIDCWVGALRVAGKDKSLCDLHTRWKYLPCFSSMSTSINLAPAASRASLRSARNVSVGEYDP